MATILIVDDRSSNRQFLTTLLGYGGHRLLEAVNGADALDLARAERPDLVITDILMPAMDGFEFTQRLRSDPALAATPVIFHTATYSEREAERLAKSCGVRSVVPKPCDPVQMLEAVNLELGAAAPVAASPPGADPGAAEDHAAPKPEELLNLHFDGLHAAKQDLDRVVAGSAAGRKGIQQSWERLQQNVAGLQHIASRLSALIEVVMEMTQERDPERLVKLFFGAACDMIESKYAAIGILDDDERKLRYVLTRNLDPGIYANDTGVGSGLFDPLLSPRRALRVHRENAKLGGNDFPPGHPSVRSVLAVAIATREKVYGWLYFADRPDAQEFSDEDERLAAILAAQLALLYEHAQLFDLIQRHAANLQMEALERKRAQDALHESAAGLHRAQLMAKLAHVITGPDGAFETWSETLPQLIGVEAARMPASTREWLGLIHPEDRATFRAKAIEAGASGARQDIEYRMQRSDGAWIDVRQVTEPLLAQATPTRTQRWFGTLQDVTEQKRVEEALQASEERLRAMFEKAAVGITHSDLDGGFVVVNPKLCEITGYSHTELRSLTFRHLTHPDDVQKSIEFRARLLEGTIAPYEREARLVRKDRSVIWVNVTTSLVRAADGTPLHFISVLHDVTERKRMEQAVRETEAKYRGIFENSVEGIFQTSVEGRVLTSNEAAARMLGYDSPEEAVATLTDVSSQVYVDPEARQELLQALKTDGFARGLEMRYRRKDGSTFWVSVSARMMRDERGEFVLGMMQDITERRRAAHELQQFRMAMDVSVDAIYLTDPATMRFVYLNDTACKRLGYPREKLLQLGPQDVLAMDREQISREYAEVIAAGDHGWTHERTFVRSDGSKGWTELNRRALRTEGGTLIVTIARDITERKKAEERIRALNRVYAMLSGINATIVRVGSREELFRESCRIAFEVGRFKFAWICIVDREAMELKPVAWMGDERGFLEQARIRRSLRDDAPAGQGLSVQSVKEGKAVIVNDIDSDPRVRFRKEHLERGVRSLAILPLLVGEKVAGTIGLHASEAGFFDEEEVKLLSELAGDIAFALEHIEKSEKVDYLAYYDALTGLANRTLFHERLTQQLHAAQAGGHKVGLMIGDLERFKSINDSLGRQAGDQLLKQLAERLRSFAPDPIEVARVGADQFAVAIPDVRQENDVARFVEQGMQECLGAPFALGSTNLKVRAKVGIALYPNDGAEADTLYRSAEAALERAKSAGNSYVFFAEEMTERVAGKLALEHELQGALEKEEFVLHYQVKVDIESRRIVGVEALIRWRSPQRGLVPPGHFIPLLEETGLILEVGAWAMQRAVLDHRHWLRQGVAAPRVAVNVSQVQLRQRDFLEVVRKVVQQGANPTGLDLEITESMVMHDIEGSIAKLKAARELGIAIAIDDFGTGYSSLGYLAKLPVQALKIDRSFIVSMASDPDAMTLISTIISLAHSLRLQVVAEGVETEEQARMLRLLRCDQIQGYLIGRPQPIEELTPLLLAQK